MNIKGDDYTPISPSLILQGVDDFDNNFYGIIDSLRISTLAEQKLKLLMDYFFDKADSEEEPDYSEFDEYLAEFEEDILRNSNNYSPLENSILLSAIVTARYSTFYWYNYYKNNSANYTNYKAANDNPPQRRWWHWVIVGAADTVGAFAGAAVNPGVAVTAASSASTAAYTMTNPRTK